MFRKELPRIYELRDQIKDPDSPNSSFQRSFEQALQSPEAMRAWGTIENELKGLDSVAWKFLKEEACEYLNTWGVRYGRELLFTILNQASAYNFLRKSGWSDIHFVPRSKKKDEKTPDLQGTSGLNKILCEVKTINISNTEALFRNSNDIRLREPLSELPQGFFRKLKKAMDKAKVQLETYDKNNEAKHMVYIIINFDDFWGESKEEYFDQIDRYLCKNTVQIEIVFHNHRTPFHRAITMKCATVFNE